MIFFKNYHNIAYIKEEHFPGFSALLVAVMMGVTTDAQAYSAMEGRTLSLFLFKFSEFTMHL